jgi:hypothetical protein
VRDDVRRALAITPSSPMEERTIDITTTGRRSGRPRRIEIVFYRFGDDLYLSGVPALQHGVVADLPAVATVITDPVERRRVLAEVVEEFNRRNGPDGPWPRAVLDEWVDRSPLAGVELVEPD